MKQPRYMMIVALVIALSMLMAACGEDEDDNGDDNGDNGGLGESFSFTPEGNGLTISFDYPEDWFAAQAPDGSVAVANSQDALNLVGQQAVTTDDLPENAIAIQVAALPGAGAPGEGAPGELIGFLGEAGAGPPGFELSFGEPSEAAMSGADDAASADVSGGLDGEIVIGQYGENYVLVLAISNSYGDFEGTVDEMLDTFEVEDVASE
ncbi:MAG: hypothetical protein ACLFTK_09075 [Anaerolineales bacterium]